MFISYKQIKVKFGGIPPPYKTWRLGLKAIILIASLLWQVITTPVASAPYIIEHRPIVYTTERRAIVHVDEIENGAIVNTISQ